METDYFPLKGDSADQITNKPDLFKSNVAGLSSINPKDASSLTSLQTFRLNLVNMYITDSLNTRPPNKILQARSIYGLCGISIHTAYKLSHNSAWSILMYGPIIDGNHFHVAFD